MKSSKLKILLIGPLASPIVQRLRLALENHGGHDVIVACFDAPDSGDKKTISLGKLKRYSDYLKFWKVNKIVKEIKPDVVHAHIINHYGIMSVFQPKPLLVALWGSDVLLSKTLKNTLKINIFKAINFIVAQRADYLHTSSEVVRDKIKELNQGFAKKTTVFYWGFPVPKPNAQELEKIAEALNKELVLPESQKLIVFPRGLAPVYDPEATAKIINFLLAKSTPYKIIVFKAFSTEAQLDEFKKLLLDNVAKVIIVNRLLTGQELYYIYSRSAYHFSIPKSDALGGGVVEPALLGSYPVLSNIDSYKAYKGKQPSYIINDYTERSLEDLNNFINTHSLGHTLPIGYSAQEIVGKFHAVYQAMVMAKK